MRFKVHVEEAGPHSSGGTGGIPDHPMMASAPASFKQVTDFSDPKQVSDAFSYMHKLKDMGNPLQMCHDNIKYVERIDAEFPRSSSLKDDYLLFQQEDGSQELGNKITKVGNKGCFSNWYQSSYCKSSQSIHLL